MVRPFASYPPLEEVAERPEEDCVESSQFQVTPGKQTPRSFVCIQNFHSYYPKKPFINFYRNQIIRLMVSLFLHLTLAWCFTNCE